ncbi:hypothetical protein [Rhizobium grahamii]|nr:hypothetical protein [Rhizobium grahamii]
MTRFIAFAKEDLTIWGPDLIFDEPIWDVTDSYFVRGRPHRIKLRFCDRDKEGTFTPVPLEEPFAAQIKSVLRYRESIERREAAPLLSLSAYKTLLQAYRTTGMVPNLTNLTSSLVDTAVAIAGETSSYHAARVGVALAELSRFLFTNRLAPFAPPDYRHGVSRSYRKASEKGLPSEEALEALPKARLLATHPRDVILTNVMALLVVAPSRINELFALPSHCEVRPLDPHDDRYMLWWAGSKRHQDFIKGIPEALTPLAKESIGLLRKCTSAARDVALWYEKNPGALFLTSDLEHLRGKDLSVDDISLITGITSKWWATNRRLKSVVGGPTARYSFGEVERLFIAMLPSTFPIMDRKTGLKFSEALLVVPKNLFDMKTQAFTCMFEPITYSRVQEGFMKAGGYSHASACRRQTSL